MDEKKPLDENNYTDDNEECGYNTYEIFFANDKKRFEKEQKFYMISICLGIFFILHAALYLFSPIGGDRTNWVDATGWEWVIAATGIGILVWNIRRLSRLRSCRQDLDDGVIKPVKQVEYYHTGVSESTLAEVVSDDYYKKGVALPTIIVGSILFFMELYIFVRILKKGDYFDWMAAFYPAYTVIIFGVFKIKKYRTIKELYFRGKIHIPNELKKEIKKNKKRK